MKDISIEDAIYLCKYHDTDKNIKKTLRLEDRDIVKLLAEYKGNGLYERYRNMTGTEVEQIIKANKKEKIEKKEYKNQLLDLNDILFEQLHTLTLMRDDLTENEFKHTIETSKQVVSVSQTIINNANLLLQAKKHFDTTGTKNNEVASLLRLNE